MKIINITKSFGDHLVLDHLNYEFSEGENVMLMAPSGKGKTSLLKIIAGLLEADEGQIEMGEKRLSVVFQEDRLCEDFSGLSNVRMACGKSKEELTSHFEEVGLLEAMEMPVKEYSGGMKRRIAIARAIAYEPDLLILDEPFKGLDLEMKDQVAAYIKKHCKSTRIIMASHDLTDAEYFNAKIINL